MDLLAVAWGLAVLGSAAMPSDELRAKPPSEDGAEQGREAEAEKWNDEGLRLFQEGKFAQAAVAFQRVYALFPNIPDVPYNLGLALLRSERFEEAIPPLEGAVALSPRDAAVRTALGVALLQVNRMQEGAEQLELSLRDDPASVDTLYFLALAYYHLKDPDRAERCLRWMFERNPDSALLRLRTGNAMRINRRYQDALRELQRAADLDPRLPDLYLELALTYIGLRDAQKAEEALREEIRHRPGSAEAHLTLGEIFLVIKRDYEQAIASIRRAEALGIAPVRVEFDLGDAYWRMGRIEEAESHLLKTVELDPKHRRAHYLLGNLYRRLGQKARAQERFDAVASLAKEEQRELVTSFRTMVEGQLSEK